jgi:hypothetical protein
VENRGITRRTARMQKKWVFWIRYPSKNLNL